MALRVAGHPFLLPRGPSYQAIRGRHDIHKSVRGYRQFHACGISGNRPFHAVRPCRNTPHIPAAVLPAPDHRATLAHRLFLIARRRNDSRIHGLALQIYIGGARFNAESIVPNIVVLGITRELGPVIASLMVAGRVAAAIAAEIGTMRVTEQIDALRTLSTNPFKYLVAPRLIAGVIALPLLVLIADIIGVMGGWLVATQGLGFNSSVYIQNSYDFVEMGDVLSGLYKAAVFGFIIAMMGCYQGFNSKGGAQGVGRATTNAVVFASILILAANYLMTSLLFNEGVTPL